MTTGTGQVIAQAFVSYYKGMRSAQVPAVQGAAAGDDLPPEVLALMEHLEQTQAATVTAPTAPALTEPSEEVTKHLKELYGILVVQRCITCNRDHEYCTGGDKCPTRRVVHMRRNERPSGPKGCVACGTDQVHAVGECAVLAEVSDGQWDLDVCPECLWPKGSRYYEQVHADEDAHWWLATNLKSIMGVFLFRREPYGIANWYQLRTKLNQRRRLPFVSSGQLLADLNDYMTTFLGIRRDKNFYYRARVRINDRDVYWPTVTATTQAEDQERFLNAVGWPASA